MKVLKPNRLSLITRSFEVRRTFEMGLSILAFFDIKTGSILEEVELWKFAADELGKDAAIDAGIPKTKAEYLVRGNVFVPGGKAQGTCPLTVKIGGLEKTLYVVGDRFWKGNQQSEPQPFSSMPISWELAFGGEGYNKNPLGKGFEPVETDYGPVQFLPNIELPGKMVISPNQRPDPAGLRPIDITWPQRFSKVGTYDRKWLEELFPGFARDIDWTIHNMAPDDQQQSEPFVGVEDIRVVNMHPTEPILEGRLPGIRARAFVTQRRGEHEEFLEIPMRLMTVWLFPHVVKGILVFQGSHRTAEDDAADIVHLMIAAERLGEDKGVPHYQTVLGNRLDKEDGVFHALRDSDLLPVFPEGLAKGAAADDVALVTMEGLVGQNIRKKAEKDVAEAREIVRGYGLDPDKAGPLMPQPLAPLPDDPIEMNRFLEDLGKRAEAEFAELEKRKEQALRDVEPLLRAAGRTPEELRQEMEGTRFGPPDFTAEREIARIRELAAEMRSIGLVVDELEEWSTDEERHSQWREMEQQIRNMYLLSAHQQGPVPLRDDAGNARVREEVLAIYRAGGSFAYRDLSGADLSGLDLSGADFRSGWLESVLFHGTNLQGADMRDAVLARADLSGALIGGTSFKGANLGGARLTAVVVEGATDLSNANMMKADLTGARLNGANITKTDFDEAIFSNTEMKGVIGEGLSFFKTDLKGVTFEGARLENTAFIDCDLGGVDFSDSRLEQVSFVQCKGKGIKLFRARGTMMTAVLCESFAKADLRGASLETANLRGLDLEGSDLSGATFEGSDLSEAVLKGARLYRLVARGVRLVRTDLRDADLTSADLMGADLQKADLRGTTLKGANLFGANFGRVRSDEATDLHDSNQKRVTIYPLRHE